MQIITTEQAILHLILKYHDKPDQAALENTLKKIRFYWPVTEHSMSLDWIFNLTAESLFKLSKKYLNQDLLMNKKDYKLIVDSITLSFRIISWEEYINDFQRIKDRTLLGL